MSVWHVCGTPVVREQIGPARDTVACGRGDCTDGSQSTALTMDTLAGWRSTTFVRSGWTGTISLP
jgi:hypothetical protein